MDLQTLKESLVSPFLSEFSKNKLHTCRIEKPSYKGYLYDLLVLHHPIPKPLTPNVFGIDQCLLTETQLLEYNFPLNLSENWVETNESGEHVGILGLDCEMVKTTKGFELARVSLVNSAGIVLYDNFTKPQNSIIDYLTQYSGITAETLESAKSTHSDIQKDLIARINSSAVVCGHSLENDMNALKLIHRKIADSSVLYPHSIVGLKIGLKKLAQKYLKKTIQNVWLIQGSHNSIEDALTAMKLVELKIAKGPNFGIPDCVYQEKHIFELIGANELKTVVVDTHLSRELVRGNVSIDHSANVEKYINSSINLVVCEWKDIQKLDINNKKEGKNKILTDWDSRVQKMVENSSENSLFVLMSGEGDTLLADQ